MPMIRPRPISLGHTLRIPATANGPPDAPIKWRPSVLRHCEKSRTTMRRRRTAQPAPNRGLGRIPPWGFSTPKDLRRAAVIAPIQDGRGGQGDHRRDIPMAMFTAHTRSCSHSILRPRLPQASASASPASPRPPHPLASNNSPPRADIRQRARMKRARVRSLSLRPESPAGHTGF